MSHLLKLTVAAVLVLVAGFLVASPVMADANLVPLDGSQEGIKPSDFGYRIETDTTGKHVTVVFFLNPAAAKSFGHADLSLTKAGNTVVEATLGLTLDGDKGGRLSLKFDPQSIDDGELMIWSDQIEGHFAGVRDFAGFRVSIEKLLTQAHEAETKAKSIAAPAPSPADAANQIPPGAILQLGKYYRRTDPPDPNDNDVRGPEDEYPLAISPDGAILAAGNHPPGTSWNRSVCLWDLKTGRELQQLHVKEDVLQALAFSPDAKTLAWGGYGKVHLFDIARGEARLQLKTVEQTNIRSLAFSPDSKQIASNGGKQIYVWNATTGEEIRQFTATSRRAHSIAISPDGKTLAAMSGESIDVWEIASGKHLRNLPNNPDGYPLGAVAFSPDGTLLLAATKNHLQHWDVATWESHLRREFESTTFFTAAFAPDGKTFAACDYYSVRMFETKSGQEIFRFKPYDNGGDTDFSSFAFLPDGKTMATADDQGVVFLWDVARLRTLDAKASEKSKIATLQSMVANLAAENRTLREELWQAKYVLRQTRFHLLHALHGYFDGAPINQSKVADAASLALKLASTERGNKLIWEILVQAKVLKDGMTLADAEKLLGPPTKKTDAHVEWYFNDAGRHVAPCLSAKKTDNGLESWRLGNR